MQSLTQLYKDLMQGVDLTPADEVVALLLLAAHQRNMRRRHIKRKLAGKSCCQGPPDSCHKQDLQLPNSKHSPDGQQQQQQQERQQQVLEKQNGHCLPSGAKHDGLERDSGCRNGAVQHRSHSQQKASPELTSASPTSSAVTSTYPTTDSSTSSSSNSVPFATENSAQMALNAGWIGNQSPACQQAGQYQGTQQQQQQAGSTYCNDDFVDAPPQQLQQQPQPQEQSSQQCIRQQPGHQHGATQPGKQKNKRPKLKQMHVASGVDVEQGWGAGDDTEGSDADYDADDGNVSVFEKGRGCGFPCVITPSSMAAEVAPNLTQQEAADLYLGQSCPFKTRPGLSPLHCQSARVIHR